MRVIRKGGAVNWMSDRWHDLTNAGSGAWLAIAAWVALAVGIAALIFMWRHARRNRELVVEQVRPQVVMFMEPSPADWHLIEVVVRNFGRTAAYDVKPTFLRPLTVARYEDEYDDGRPEVAPLPMPETLPVLAPGQEWRTVWDSQIDREELGEAIETRFEGVLNYADAPAGDGKGNGKRREYQTKIDLDWDSLQPAERLESLIGHDFSRRERHKLELLRSMLTYYSYATKENRTDVLQSEIERMNRAAEETQERLRDNNNYEPPTDIVDIRWMRDHQAAADDPAGRHHHPN
jgi:hypothetical protein